MFDVRAETNNRYKQQRPKIRTCNYKILNSEKTCTNWNGLTDHLTMVTDLLFVLVG